MPIQPKPEWQSSHGVESLRIGLLRLECDYRTDGYIIRINDATLKVRPKSVEEARRAAEEAAARMLNHTSQLLDAVRFEQ